MNVDTATPDEKTILPAPEVDVGIDALGFYLPPYALNLADLAAARHVETDKYQAGLGQYLMSVPAPSEDTVTMGAGAAADVLRFIDPTEIDTLLFATETGIDQSKAGGVYIHRLLDLPPTCRVLELKQACYAGTGALQLALALVNYRPEKKVLVIASDIARYGLQHPAEPTQGAGAIAMAVSANPRLLSIHRATGLYTEDVMDFWKPNYVQEALVNGKYSTLVYLKALTEVWKNYQSQQDSLPYADLDYFCYHTPLARLVEKAQKQLASLNGITLSEENALKLNQPILNYARQTGNVYTASLYVSLLSLLETRELDLTANQIGFYSYGSGCVAEYFSGKVLPNYHERIDQNRHQQMLQNRQTLTVAEYEDFYRMTLPTDGSEYYFPSYNSGRFRLAGIKNHQRLYEKVL